MCNNLVSICIPTFNGEQFINEALESAILQTYSNLEIVVSDDASNDKTLELIEQFKEKTNIPIHIYHHKPSGIGANWNNCIKHAKGEYIKLLFQDDVLLPTCVEKMVRILEKDSQIGLVACKREFIIETSHNTPETSKWIRGYGDLQKDLGIEFKNGIGYLDNTLFQSELFLCSPLNKVGEPPVTLFRRKLIKEIGYFREDLKQILDYEFYYRVLKKYKIAILEKELVQFRLHAQQATNKNKGNDLEDYKKYDEIIYKQYFWFLNRKKQLELMKKYNPIIRLLIKIKRKLRL